MLVGYSQMGSIFSTFGKDSTNDPKLQIKFMSLIVESIHKAIKHSVLVSSHVVGS